jgi:hypothetical protein
VQGISGGLTGCNVRLNTNLYLVQRSRIREFIPPLPFSLSWSEEVQHYKLNVWAYLSPAFATNLLTIIFGDR